MMDAWYRVVLSVCLVFGLAWMTGCRMCQDSFDSTYGAFGGVLGRTDPVRGRVGSAFGDHTRLASESTSQPLGIGFGTSAAPDHEDSSAGDDDSSSPDSSLPGDDQFDDLERVPRGSEGSDEKPFPRERFDGRLPYEKPDYVPPGRDGPGKRQPAEQVPGPLLDTHRTPAGHWSR